MGREIDERKKRKALRKLRKAASLAEQGLGPALSDWEREFLEDVEARVEKYGSAFQDLDKGAADDSLSALQHLKLKQIDKKVRGKTTGFKQRRPLGSKKKPAYTPRIRQIDEAFDSAPATPPVKPHRPKLVKASDMPKDTALRKAKLTHTARPSLRVIKGGAGED